MAQTEATQNKIEALTAVAAACASLFVAIGGYIINQHGQRIDLVGKQNSALEVKYATINEHVSNHENTAAHWISVIKECQQNDTRLLARINKLETKPVARADPFTGTQGAQLKDMINDLRRQMHLPRFNFNSKSEQEQP